eukprot:PITA_17968
MQDKIRKWTIRSLNLVRQLVLTKVVLQSIPIFTLSALPAPKGVLQRLRTIQRDFLWGKGEERKKWALVAWDKLCKPKSHGGLGLDDPDVLSKILGEKLWWRWVKDPKAQWQQEPTLLREDFLDLKKETDTKGLFRVKDFWEHPSLEDKWRTWKNIECGVDNSLKTKIEALLRILEQRKIVVLEGHDQLIWGNNKEVTFNIKEDKKVFLELDSHIPNRVW